AVADLGRYWPRGAAPGARRWVTRNMADGTVESIEVEIGLRLPGGVAQETRVETLDGTLTASALTIHYFKPLPPIRDAVGTARFDIQEFVAEIGGGGVGAIEIENGRIRIGGLDQPDARFEIDGTLRGPLRDALRILDHPRFGYAGRFGIDPTTTAGDVAMRLSIAFDDRPDTTLADVRFEADAEVTDAVLGKAMFGYSVAEADLAVTVNNDNLTVGGEARISGVPTHLSWTENFGDAELRSEITLSGAPDADQIAEFGLDVRRFLDGPVGTELVHRRFADDSGSLDASFDLAGAALDLPLFGWHKSAGEGGAANLVVELEGGRPVAVPEFTVAAGSLAATGRARFATGGKELAGIEFDSLDFGESRLQDVAAQFADDRVTVTIGGGRFDATSLLKARASKESRRPFVLTAEQLDWVMLGPNRGLEDVSLSVQHDGRFWDEFVLDGMLPGRQELTVRYLPAPAGKRRLSVVANDAGAALRAFGIVDTVVGGQLSIVAEATDDEPDRPLRGTVEISRFRLVRAPTVARVLSVAALTGLIDMLTGDGLLFNRFTGEFVKTGDKLEVSLARAYGPSLGFTATGEIDLAANTYDLEGTIVPAYALNSILGNIPVIGDLLQGGKGEGLFAATYTVTGPRDDPKVTVNPLAALAPGFLRALFDLFDGGDAGEPVRPTALPETGNLK
ncbi:MAG TPA: AsmA-like C-terminal domain-containing protein, partial [Dongiaceae bacterium]|nr:AsmA-like C-terminal domain-containing protein [Dongiaceae bacterium]